MQSTTRSAFLLGVRDATPFVLVIAPFGMLFGLVATEAGWTLTQVMAMTILVIAGASQFTAVQLIAENAPTLVVILTALAVNLRLAMYSASLAVHLAGASLGQRAALAYLLVDQTYGLAIGRYSGAQTWSRGDKLSYFFGASAPVVPLWYAFTWVGAVAGSAVPEAWALDFAVPITFLAMIGPMLRNRPSVLAAATAVVLSLAFNGIPYSLGILVAAAGGMAVGALAERTGAHPEPWGGHLPSALFVSGPHRRSPRAGLGAAALAVRAGGRSAGARCAHGGMACSDGRGS
jgi:predicted branched-subunit amino acid permease